MRSKLTPQSRHTVQLLTAVPLEEPESLAHSHLPNVLVPNSTPLSLVTSNNDEGDSVGEGVLSQSGGVNQGALQEENVLQVSLLFSKHRLF
jgi:hypothetical protein